MNIEHFHLRQSPCFEQASVFASKTTVGARWRKNAKPDVFTRTELYLSSGPLIEQFLSLDERQALVIELLEAVPGIVAQCQKKPCAGRGLFAGECQEGAVVVWSVYNARVSIT